MKMIKTKYLLPINQPPIKNGALVLDKRRIIAIGAYSDLIKRHPNSKVEDLSNYIILPGFVNCHTHLELSTLNNKLKPKHSFTEWLKEVVALKSQLSQEEIIKGIQSSIAELLKWGVIALGEISSDYLSYQELIKSALIGKVFWEFIAVNPSDIEIRLNRLIQALPQTKCSQNNIVTGISPHSSYTLCSEAFATIINYIKQHEYHCAIHVGESQEEKLFFNKRQGKLFDFINNIYPVSPDIDANSPLNYLYSKGYLIKNAMLIHLNIITNDEIAILKKLNLSVIHCPLSHNFFGHPPFQLEKLLKNDINIALGTDSLASTRTLNFFEEMRHLHKIFPFLLSEQIIKMATINGAKALQLPKGIGEIMENTPCYLIAIQSSNTISDPYQAVIENNSPVIHL